MIPVMQTIADPVKGDCLRACVASILELPADQVPNFMDLDDWFLHPENGLWNFLQRHGYEYVGHQPPLKAIELSNGIDGYYIGSVSSINFPGKTHAIVFKGTEFVHDPSYLSQWNGTIDEVNYFYMIEKIKEK